MFLVEAYTSPSGTLRAHNESKRIDTSVLEDITYLIVNVKLTFDISNGTIHTVRLK